MWRLRPAVLAGAAWALLAVYLGRRRLRLDGMRAHVPWPIGLPTTGARGVNGVLHRLSPTCLERALVAQAWRAAHGDPRDIVIGVPPGGLKQAPAHAWLDGVDTASPAAHVEIHRLAPPTRPTRRHW